MVIGWERWVWDEEVVRTGQGPTGCAHGGEAVILCKFAEGFFSTHKKDVGYAMINQSVPVICSHQMPNFFFS